MIRSPQTVFPLLLSLVACDGAHHDSAPGTPGTPAATAAPAASQLILATDPGAAKSVGAAKTAGAAASVVIAGRIRSTVKGYLAFTLMDLQVPYCGEQSEDGCKTPWDYCCEDSKKITDNSLAVEARAADGQPIATPALPDLRLLDAVKVTGKLTQDEHGNYMLLATGIYRSERPALPDGLRWPH